jgi:hypothetical protein
MKPLSTLFFDPAPGPAWTAPEARPSDRFIPPAVLRSSFLQSVLASSRLRAGRGRELVRASHERVFDDCAGARLSGWYAPAAAADPLGLVVLIHGWGGGADSVYVAGGGGVFRRHGFSVFRLNLRDHGGTHHLNEGLFYATLIEETTAAVRRAAQLEPGRPVFLVGFSLGGNFALRVGLQAEADPIPGLVHVAAISPLLDPARASEAIDHHPVFRWYFMRKWKKSLGRKQELYPWRYDFSPTLRKKTVMDATWDLLERYSPYQTPAEYFDLYTLTGNRLSRLQTAATIITAADDPIIPADDFRDLRLNPRTRLIVHPHGGHCGFVSRPLGDAWHETYLVRLFQGFLADSGKNQDAEKT